MIWERPYIMPGLISYAFGTLAFGSFYLVSLVFDMLVDNKYNLGENLYQSLPYQLNQFLNIDVIYEYHQNERPQLTKR